VNPTELSDILFNHYAYVAGQGAMMELQMRLLAGRTPELASYAHDQNLDGLELKIHTHFDSKFTAEEKEFLKKARGLRNKILHSDFKAAATKTNELSPQRQAGPSVFALKLSTSEVRPIADMTKRDAGVFGWMLECAQTGVFKEAESIFAKANQIYKRVTFEAATEGIDPAILAKMMGKPTE
jgi:hypothetical protein